MKRTYNLILSILGGFQSVSQYIAQMQATIFVHGRL